MLFLPDLCMKWSSDWWYLSLPNWQAAYPASRNCAHTAAWLQVMQMYDKAEADYTELSSKKRIVEADRKKIEKVLPVPAPALRAAYKKHCDMHLLPAHLCVLLPHVHGGPP